MSVDMMERLKAMLDDAPKAKSEPKPKSEPKAKVAKVESKPEPTPEPTPDGVTVPFVVLDDGVTFSDLRGCKVFFADTTTDEIKADMLSGAIEVSDLLTLRDAVRTILRIVG